MSGHLLLGVYVGGLLSSIALHWLYQRSAARDEKRWRAEMERCRDEICRLRLTDAEREVLNRAASHWMHLHPGVAWEGDVGDAMAAAVAEITRLREEVAKLRLTDAEREAVDTAAYAVEQLYPLTGYGLADTLRALLARHGGGE